MSDADDTRRLPVRSVVVLGLLSTFGPLSLDLYLPALPELTDDLGTTASGAQLTITACLLGLALGQLVAGPLSDRFGRRRPLLVGLVGYLLASAACALAPTVELLVTLRLLQGLAGAAGLVIARAIARDLYSGARLVTFFARLTLISGLAPVIAPVLGGQLNRVLDWRGLFVVLAGLGAALLAAGLAQAETLPPARRTAGGLGATLHGFGVLLRDRRFVGVALAVGLASASLFAYIAGATFVLQRLHGLSAQGFSLAFGANSLGIMAASQLGAVLARRTSPVRVLGLGLAVNLVGALTVLAAALTGVGLPLLLPALFVMVSSLGLVFPTGTALAMAGHPDRAGTASSLLGLGQFLFGAVVAPLVGVAGETTAVPLGLVAAGASLAGGAVFLSLVRRPAPRRPGPLPPAPPAG